MPSYLPRMAPEPIVIRRSVWGVLLLTVGAVALVAISAMLFTEGAGGWVFPTAGALGIVVFSGGVVVGLRRLFSHVPVLRVEERGVFDGTPGMGVGWISWEETEFIGVCRSLGNTYLLIQVLEGERILRRQPWYRRFALRCCRHLDRSQITISSVLLSVPMEELRERLSDFVEDVADAGPTA